ncbi:response regulator transcription factor [Cytobacillus dafuensis]|uniref:Response regulator transcription factor n=1 Tax=Cytobacillus dafuensis TaxID=1742359 RepID=A0A5B8Z4H2_CYTDA|nr:response regulator transcription factor [Cytobacillus dafuensis]
MIKVMIIEDDFKLRTMIAEHLGKWNFEPIMISDFEKIDENVIENTPDIVLLDINLPSFDGFYWCGKIRRVSDVPIIFISSRTENMDIVMAMNMGGDDFIQKPFSLDVLVAKMNAVYRRTNQNHQSDKDIITAGELVLNLSNGIATYQEKEVALTKNEYHILYLLMRKSGQIISRDEIMRALWEDEQFIDDNTLTVNINRLRKKLETIGLADVIVTKKRQGYLLQ